MTPTKLWPVDGAPYTLVEEMYPTGFFRFGREVELAILRRPREGDYILRPADMAYGWAVRWVLPPDWAGVHTCDGQWVAALDHERVEHDDFEVPLYAEADRLREERAWREAGGVLRGLRWRALRWGHVR